MDSVPLVCISGQVPTHLIGTDAFQEADTTGITRPCTKHNWLVKDVKDLSKIMHKAFEVATSGRPGPVLVDIPKDIQFNKTKYISYKNKKQLNSKKNNFFTQKDIETAIEYFKKSSKPIIYTGGGVVNSGPEASTFLRELVAITGFPITSTLQGLGCYPGEDNQFIGMLGMHGTFEANNAMHDCDLLINIGARFDDRITGKIDEFSPKSKKIHVDIDPSSIGKNVKVGPSPLWLKDRLESIGQRSINNLVDISNYVMMDIGHPTHIFDYDKLGSKEILIRRGKKGEKITTLDEVERKISQNELLITNGKKPIAIAGVIGGLDSAVNENTSNVLIESAYFEASVVRKGAKSLGMSTDASKRFERGADPIGAENAFWRIVSLIEEIAEGVWVLSLIHI